MAHTKTESHLRKILQEGRKHVLSLMLVFKLIILHPWKYIVLCISIPNQTHLIKCFIKFTLSSTQFSHCIT